MNILLQPIVELLNIALTSLHSFTLDWGIAIVLLTLLIRLLLFPFSLRMARQQISQAKMQPALAELRGKFAGDSAKLAQETMDVYRRFGVKPVSMIAMSLIQAPVFLSLYRLFAAHGATMTSQILPWMSTLGVYDPLHILPLVYALVTFASMLIPLTSEAATAGSLLSRVGLPLMMTVVMTAVIWLTPSAVGLYWTTNSLIAIAERVFFRTAVGKRWVMQGVKLPSALA